MDEGSALIHYKPGQESVVVLCDFDTKGIATVCKLVEDLVLRDSVRNKTPQYSIVLMSGSCRHVPSAHSSR